MVSCEAFDSVGAKVGMSVGLTDGADVGARDGVNVGALVGTKDGAAEGGMVGTEDGENVGFGADGAGVGLVVTLRCKPCKYAEAA